MFKLTRYATPESVAQADRHQWPVKVSVANTSDNSPANVLVMRAAAPGAWMGATFSCVASAQQMDDLPVDQAGPGGPYYRVSQVTAMCRSAEAAEEFGFKVEYAIRDLANNIHAASLLSVLSEITITPDV